MKKLHLLMLLAGTLFIVSPSNSQPSKEAMAYHTPKKTPTQAANHLAKFSVYDYTTKNPIDHAVIMDEHGNELGQTNTKGNLDIHLPMNTNAYYTIVAEGFDPMRLRLDQSGKKSGKYEVFLPSVELGYTRKDVAEEIKSVDTKEMVKVYVKQDPSTYQKKEMQGGEIKFSVQLAASSNPIPEKSSREQWQEIGNVYIQQENNMYKLRIGPFNTQTEAKEALLAVKAKGRKDAFIVVQQGSDDPIPASENVPHVIKEEVPAPSTDSAVKGDFKVRVASYLQPGSFNPEGIDQLGTLESYRRGEWTIMMIGGFTNLEEARRAKNIVVSKGFTDATVVVDKEGIIEAVEEN